MAVACGCQAACRTHARRTHLHLSCRSGYLPLYQSKPCACPHSSGEAEPSRTGRAGAGCISNRRTVLSGTLVAAVASTGRDRPPRLTQVCDVSERLRAARVAIGMVGILAVAAITAVAAESRAFVLWASAALALSVGLAVWREGGSRRGALPRGRAFGPPHELSARPAMYLRISLENQS